MPIGPFKKVTDVVEEGVTSVTKAVKTVEVAAFQGFEDSLNFAKQTSKRVGTEISSGASDVLDTVSDVADDTASLAEEVYGTAYDDLRDTYNTVNDDLEKLSKKVVDGAEKLGGTIVNEGVDIAEKGLNEAKGFVSDLSDDVIRSIAEGFAKAGEDCSSVIFNALNKFKVAIDGATDLKDGIKDGDIKKTITGLVKLLKFGALGGIIGKIEDRDTGCIVIYVQASGGAVVGGSGAVGVAVDIDIYIYMVKNIDRFYNSLVKGNGKNPFEEFKGPIMSFVAAAGVSVGASAGGGVDLLIGYHINNPDKITGPCIDVTLQLKAKAGGTVAIGLDPTTGFPPDMVQFVVGVGAGAEVEVSIGVSYATLLAMIHSDLVISGHWNPHDSRQTEFPTPEAAKKDSDPDFYWNKYSWDELGTSNQNLWSKLGWNLSNWDGEVHHYPDTFTISWSSLTTDQRNTTTALGYTQQSWDFDAPRGALARKTTNPDNYWYNFDWKDIGRHEQKLWKKLGWGSHNWDADWPKAATQYKDWKQLKFEQQTAASLLGYTKKSWYATKDTLAADFHKATRKTMDYEFSSLFRQYVVATEGGIWEYIGETWFQVPSSRIEEFGLAHGTTFYKIQNVSKLDVRSGWWIDHVIVNDTMIGGAGGTQETLITLANGEYLSKVEISYADKDYIHFLKFHTNKNQTVEGGRRAAYDYVQQTTKEGRLIAIGGNADNFVRRLIFVFE